MKAAFQNYSMNALTGPNSNAVGDADTVVNDSEHVDVVLQACIQAWNPAGGGISGNSQL